MAKFQSIVDFCKKPPFILGLILAAFFLKGLFLASVFPIFQGPDEQVHYGTTQFYAEPSGKNWSIEYRAGNEVQINGHDIYTYGFSEEVKKTAKMTAFDEIKFQKNNTPDFAEGYEGKNEAEIIRNFWKRYIDVYPPNTSGDSKLYFTLTSAIEKIYSSKSILFRFFAIRIFSVFLGIAILILLYLIAKKIGFSQKIALLLTGIAAFQPMFSFMSAIINPDILLFLSFTFFAFGAVFLLKDGFSWKIISIIVLATVMGILAKGPGLVLIILAYVLCTYIAYGKLKTPKPLFFAGLAGISLVFFGLYFAIFPNSPFLELANLRTDSQFPSMRLSLIKYFDKTIGVSQFSDTAGSYWGNFGWLDHKISDSIINGILIFEAVSFFGLLLYFSARGTVPAFLPEKKYLIFFIGAIIVVQVAIRFYDWRIFDETGKILIGTPGRYFMPNLVAHFMLLATGLGFLVRKEDYFEIILKLMLVLMAILQFYSIFWLIIPRYYL